MEWSALLWAGFVATTLALACAWLFRTFEWMEMSPAAQVGCLFFDNPRLPVAEGVGLLVLFLLGTILFPAVYHPLLEGVGALAWWSGALFGLLHGVLVAAAFPLAGRVSVCVRSGRIPPPGRLGLRWGRGTPAGVLVGHAVYGGVLGAVLAAFAAPPAFPGM